jgi:hypothetical protein
LLPATGVIDDRKIESARRTAMVALILSIAVLLTAIIAAASCAEFAAWLLCLEALGIATTSLLIRADLRAEQRHTVK